MGGGGRSKGKIKPNSPSVKRSNAFRFWQEAGSKFVEQLRAKGLRSVTWCVLMVNSFRLSKDQTAVAALGIDNEGRKHVLDLRWAPL